MSDVDRIAAKKLWDWMLANSPFVTAEQGRAFGHKLIEAFAEHRKVEADGWVMVPREPTRAMIDAADQAFDLMPDTPDELAEVYRVMLAATPKAPATDAGEEGPPCENCGAPVRVGHVVLPYDDVGELHADCANPYSLTVESVADGPKPCVLVGSPMIHVPLSALASPAPNDDLRAENERLRAWIEKDAARFDHCSDMMNSSFNITGTLRAERTVKMQHYANEARAALKENRRG